MDGWGYAGVAALGYLLGSIPSGVLSSRAFRGADVRSTGSGHTGAINTYRAAGLAPAALTLLADGAKGVVAISAALKWGGDGWALPLASTFVVIGHCYPVSTRFRGGMGLTTAGGVFLVLDVVALVSLIIAWFPIRWVAERFLGNPVTKHGKDPGSEALGAARLQSREDASTYASLSVSLLLPVLLLLLSADPFVRLSGIGVGAILFWRHAQVLLGRRRSLRQPG